jgi:hypothetical protein
MNKGTDKNKDNGKRVKTRKKRSWRSSNLIWTIWKTWVIHEYRSVCEQVNRSFYYTQ